MARNVLTSTAKILQSMDGLEPEDQPAGDSVVVDRQTIAPLHQLLNQIPLEQLLESLQRLHVGFTLVSSPDDRFSMRIYGSGCFEYWARGAKSPKAAIVNALAQFFVNEKRDVHEFR